MSRIQHGRRKTDIFTRFTSAVSTAIGRPWVFVGALGVLGIWAITGPLLGFSDTWQLIINTGTTIITFLMVFIIQNTQNRDQLAANIKLVAIMRKLNITAEDLLCAEEESDKQLEAEKEKIETNRRSERTRKGGTHARQPA